MSLQTALDAIRQEIDHCYLATCFEMGTPKSAKLGFARVAITKHLPALTDAIEQLV